MPNFHAAKLISRCSIRKDAERTKGENRQEAKHGQIFPRPRLIAAQTPDQTADRTLARISKRWPNTFTMAGSRGSADTSAASIKSASQTVLGSALGTERPIKIPLARPIRVESMNHEDADAENDTRCRDHLGHSFPPCLEMPGRAA